MPQRKKPKPLHPVGKFILLAVLIGFVIYILYFVFLAFSTVVRASFTPTRIFVLWSVVWGVIWVILKVNSSAKLHQARNDGRRDETICSFARALNCCEVDTWIIRAVYEEFVHHIGYPPHLEDSLKDFDPDDIDDMALSISERVGRPLTNLEKNPYYSKVNSVKELILFFMEQARDDETKKAPV